MPRCGAIEIAQSLKSRIEAGEWAEHRIPPERDLAADFGVARNTIRRAMMMLREEGTIWRHVGRGTFIVPEVDAFSEAVARMRKASPGDMMEVRLVLEPHAASIAAVSASTSELKSVEEAHRHAKDACEIAMFEHWDAEFHDRIVASGRNELFRDICSLVGALRNQDAWFEMKQRSFSEARRAAYCLEHEAILAALLRHDPDAAANAMRAHLLSVRANLLGR